MKMYLWGEEGGKPAPNTIGVQPEWFYKGNGLNLKGHAQPLNVPDYADDGGEEPEIAGVYLISKKVFLTVWDLFRPMNSATTLWSEKTIYTWRHQKSGIVLLVLSWF